MALKSFRLSNVAGIFIWLPAWTILDQRPTGTSD